MMFWMFWMFLYSLLVKCGLGVDDVMSVIFSSGGPGGTLICFLSRGSSTLKHPFLANKLRFHKCRYCTLVRSKIKGHVTR
jgi:hypothetical protein